MLDQYLSADQNQDNTACDFCIFSELSADAVAEKDGNKAENAGGDADQKDGRDDAYLKEREADAYGERINARSDGKEPGLLCAEWIQYILNRRRPPDGIHGSY